MTQPLPLPPEVAAQQDPGFQQSVFMQQGVGQPQPGMEAVQQVVGKIQELNQWLEDTMGLLRQIQPGLTAMLAPIATAGRELATALEKTAERSGMAQGSPVMPQVQQTNPAAGPPSPMA